MEFLPKDILDALTGAENRKSRRQNRMRVVAGDESWRVLRRWQGGIALDADQVDHLRGLVELHDAGRHISTLLIVASSIENGELICAVKRETPVTNGPALDFVRINPAPAGLLPRG